MAVSVTAIVAGKSYGFDFEAQRIDIDATLDELDVVNLYTAIKDAQDDALGIIYPKIADAEGLTDLDVGVKTYLTVKLLNDWEVNTLKTSGKFTVKGGNLVRADGEDPFLDNPLITYINQLSQAGVLVETGVSGVTAGDIESMAAAVWAKVLETGFSADLILRTIAAMVAGNASGGPDGSVFRNLADTQDQVTTAADVNGNRSMSYGA